MSGASSMPPLPVLAAVAARLSWLVAGGVIGLVLGIVLSASSGYTASSVLQISATDSDSTRVRQVAQTVQRLSVSVAVLEEAAKTQGVDADLLAGRVSSAWQEDTDLVTVTVSAPEASTAISDANAVAQAAVAINRASVQEQLTQLRQDANRLLTAEKLADPAAESARLGQLGSSLASRQDTVSAQTNGLFVADTAISAAPAGLDQVTGGLAGLLAGLLLAALAAVLAGPRGLRLGRPRRARSLLPDVDLTGPGQAADLAGQLVEEGTTCLAVVAARGGGPASRDFAIDVADFIRAHGLTTSLVDIAGLPSPEKRREVLTHEARADVPGCFGSQFVVLVIAADDPAFGMLVGQSGLRAAVVGSQKTPLRAAQAALSRLCRARPVLVLAA